MERKDGRNVPRIKGTFWTGSSTARALVSSRCGLALKASSAPEPYLDAGSRVLSAQAAGQSPAAGGDV